MWDTAGRLVSHFMSHFQAVTLPVTLPSSYVGWWDGHLAHLPAGVWGVAGMLVRVYLYRLRGVAGVLGRVYLYPLRKCVILLE